MDKYKRVPKEKVDQDSIKDNEIRVVATSQRSARNYISYSMNLLTAEVCDLIAEVWAWLLGPAGRCDKLKALIELNSTG